MVNPSHCTLGVPSGVLDPGPAFACPTQSNSEGYILGQPKTQTWKTRILD